MYELLLFTKNPITDESTFKSIATSHSTSELMSIGLRDDRTIDKPWCFSLSEDSEKFSHELKTSNSEKVYKIIPIDNTHM